MYRHTHTGHILLSLTLCVILDYLSHWCWKPKNHSWEKKKQKKKQSGQKSTCLKRDIIVGDKLKHLWSDNSQHNTLLYKENFNSVLGRVHCWLCQHTCSFAAPYSWENENSPGAELPKVIIKTSIFRFGTQLKDKEVPAATEKQTIAPSVIMEDFIQNWMLF